MSLDYTLEWASQNSGIVTDPPSNARITAGYTSGKYNVNHMNWILNQLQVRCNSLYTDPIQEWDSRYNYNYRDLVRGSDGLMYISVKIAVHKGVNPVSDTDQSHWCRWGDVMAGIGEIKTFGYNDGSTYNRLLRSGWVLANGSGSSTPSTNNRFLRANSAAGVKWPTGGADATTAANSKVAATTSSNGKHKHAANNAYHRITRDETPPHTHVMRSRGGAVYTKSYRPPLYFLFEKSDKGRTTYSDRKAPWSPRQNNTIRTKRDEVAISSVAGGSGSHRHYIYTDEIGNHTHSVTANVSVTIPTNPDHVRVLNVVFTGLPAK